jgi:hypothetical protein
MLLRIGIFSVTFCESLAIMIFMELCETVYGKVYLWPYVL